ncbi:MAG: ABC transporter substrate-binding protein [Candidatus Binatia bacterium]
MANAALSADGTEKLTRIRMGLAARSTTSMPFFVAKERGFFREEGLDVELIVMQAIQTIQATLGNSTQFASATGSAVTGEHHVVLRLLEACRYGRHQLSDPDGNFIDVSDK